MKALIKKIIIVITLILLSSCVGEKESYFGINESQGGALVSDGSEAPSTGQVGSLDDGILPNVVEPESQDGGGNSTDDANGDGSTNPTNLDNQIPVNPPPTDEGVVGAPQIEAVENLFVQNKEQQRKVDILWVVDNSGSMGDDQNNLAKNFETFINGFISTKADFHMAITTTDPREGIVGKDQNDSINLLTSEKASQNPDKFIEDFKRIIKVGIQGSGNEQGFYAMEKFLQGKESYTKGFLRDDAYLAIVVVSDEPEQSKKTAQYYVDLLVEHKKGQKGLVKIYSIVTSKLVQTTTSIGGSIYNLDNKSMLGTKYMEASEMTHGLISDIKEDFHGILGSMGNTIVELLDSFALSDRPNDESKIQVFINDQANQDWEYLEDSNSIRFSEGKAPATGSTIRVNYFKEIEGH